MMKDKLLNMNLKFFDEGNQEGGEGNTGDQNQTPDGTETNQNPGTQGAGDKPPAATFTQAQLDAILKVEKDKLRKSITKDIPPQEELGEFRKWKDEQKTESERQQQLIADALSRAEAAERRVALFEQQTLVREAKVTEEFVNFVSYEVSQMPGDDEFSVKLEAYLKTRPQYTTPVNPAPTEPDGEGGTREVNLQTGGTQNNDTTPTKEEYSKMTAVEKMNFKLKYPELWMKYTGRK